MLVPEMFRYIWYTNGRTTVFLLHEVRIQLNSTKNNRLLLRATKTLYHVRLIRILRHVSLTNRFHVAVRLFNRELKHEAFLSHGRQPEVCCFRI